MIRPCLPTAREVLGDVVPLFPPDTAPDSEVHARHIADLLDLLAAEQTRHDNAMRCLMTALTDLRRDLTKETR